MDDNNVVKPNEAEITSTPSTSEQNKTPKEIVKDYEASRRESSTPKPVEEEVKELPKEATTDVKEVASDKQPDTTESDVPKSDKGIRRMQELVNRNKELEEKLTQSTNSVVNTELEQKMQFKSDMEKGVYGNTPQQELQAAYDRNQLEIMKLENQVTRNYMTTKSVIEQTRAMEATTPIFNPESDEYIDDAREMFEQFVTDSDIKMSPEKARDYITKLYGAVTSKTRSLVETQVNNKASLNVATESADAKPSMELKSPSSLADAKAIVAMVEKDKSILYRK